MNEPKKRGRPTNAEREVKAKMAELAAMSDEELAKKAKFSTFTSAPAEGARRLDPNEPVQVYRDPFDVKLAQAYALRIWAKQSVSLSRHERVGRIAAALKDQGMSMEGVELP
jgi:hypothetical protein